jgi:hypothetical protein
MKCGRGKGHVDAGSAGECRGGIFWGILQGDHLGGFPVRIPGGILWGDPQDESLEGYLGGGWAGWGFQGDVPLVPAPKLTIALTDHA